MRKFPFAILGLAVAFAGACAGRPARDDVADRIEERIQFYSRKLEKSPRLSPVHAQLGAAYLDKARLTQDPKWLAEARASLERSIAIQPSTTAYKTMARASNLAHQFKNALRWARRALPEKRISAESDPEVVALAVEAHAALGEYPQARKLLPREGTAAGNFYAATALAGLLASQSRHEEASRAYDAAAELARAENEKEAALWAEVMAAGALVDSGRTDLARPRLDTLRRTDPNHHLLRLHDAECLEAEHRLEEALAVYEALLEVRPSDGEIHSRAYKVARAIGEGGRAQRHFDAAERSFRQALDAGEVYTLDALAKLYSDAGVRLEDALALAERNLKFRRDREAHATLAEVRRRIAMTQTNTAKP